MGGTMTAEPLPKSAPPDPPHWPVPPQDGYTVDDLFNLPGLPPHTELIDGSLVFVSPQREFHSLVMYLLERGLRSTVPERLRVRREMALIVDRKQGPEPDISVVRAEAVSGPDLTAYEVADVVLAVEVVSPDSEKRDRERKPQIYAQAGIRHFWRVEQGEDARPVVYVYELDDATKAYGLAGIHHDRLKLTVPFDIDIDLAEIDRL
ncbi:Uma2 family endonuclease [Streptomyces sp. NPDC004647]|uniref:Uma2 family endonuclease n=1 Tax=Streptomyces sp. NPDC004647 TaxID=3154671 RepID=UPI0033A49716